MKNVFVIAIGVKEEKRTFFFVSFLFSEIVAMNKKQLYVSNKCISTWIIQVVMNRDHPKGKQNSKMNVQDGDRLMLSVRKYYRVFFIIKFYLMAGNIWAQMKVFFDMKFVNFILYLFFVSGGTALKDVIVQIPRAAKVMDTVTLQCSFDLEGEPLYTVKWYKGSKEFYRFIPKELPSTLVFPLPGVDVDVSNFKLHFYLKRTLRWVTGKIFVFYICWQVKK